MPACDKSIYMKTTIIVGAQGSGKSVFAGKKVEDWGKTPLYSQNPSKKAINKDILKELNELNKPHNLFIDEADVFFSCLNTRQRELFRNYWALARHKGLNESLFIARRYIQIPVFVRVSATAIYLNNTIRGHDLQRINADVASDTYLGDIKRLRDYQFLDIILNQYEKGL